MARGLLALSDPVPRAWLPGKVVFTSREHPASRLLSSFAALRDQRILNSTMGRWEDRPVGVSDCGVAPQLQRSADIRLPRFLWLRGSAPGGLAADALLPRNRLAARATECGSSDPVRAEIAHSLWSKTTIARRSGSNVARMIEIRQSGTSGSLHSGGIYASIGRQSYPVARIKMPA
jgi:hypothetical protein